MTYSHALTTVLVAQVVFFAPLLLTKKVISAHDNARELGLPEGANVDRTNRKFSDHSQIFIPEINHDLNGNRYGWLSIWNPHVQLGRPHFQATGTARSYVLANALSAVSSNPFVFYSLFSVLTASLAGVFSFLFFKSLSLSPISCATSALGISLGPLSIYWLTFVVFLSATCWAFCVLWLMTRFISKPSLPTWFGLSFAVYSLLATAYTQSIVLYAYIVGFHGVSFLLSRRDPPIDKLKTIAGLLAAALVGGAMAAPEYLDLLLNARNSTRLIGVEDDFFLAALPKFSDGRQFGGYVVSLVDPFAYGNPIDETYPLPYEGLSTTPLFFSLALIALVDWRRLWGWYVLAACFLASTLYAPAYLFAVHYLGFGLSRYLLAEGAVVIAIVLGAFALTRIPDCAPGTRRVLVCFAASALAVVYGAAWLSDAPLRRLEPTSIFVGAFVFLSLVAFIWTRSVIFVLLCLVTGIVAYSWNLVLSRPLDHVAITSPLVEALKRETADGSRFAKVGAGAPQLLPPNQEALLQLYSVNSYDSVAPEAYQQLVTRWSERGAQPYGRYFDSIDDVDAVARPDFALAGVSTLVSNRKLSSATAREVFSDNGNSIYRLGTRMFDAFQTDQYARAGESGVRLLSSTSASRVTPVSETTRYDDYRVFEASSAAEEQLLFVSQQFHPQWVASVEGRRLESTVVNDFYLGVILPPGTTRVELRFKPHVRWSWIPQVFYSVLALGWLVAVVTRRLRSRVESSSVVGAC